MGCHACPPQLGKPLLIFAKRMDCSQTNVLQTILPVLISPIMLLSAYIKLSRCSKQLSIPATACELAFARSFASAAEGKGAPRWYKEVNVVPDNEEVLL